MENVKYYASPSIKNPALVACWSGMGNVGLGAADFIRLKLKAKLLAHIDIGDLVAPEAISVQKGISSLQKFAGLVVYYVSKPPLLISIGREQLYGNSGIELMSRLIGVALKFGVNKIFTCAAFPAHMSWRDESAVYAASNSESLLKSLKEKQKLSAMEDGIISGLNGLLLEYARKKNIEACCLLATLPIYAIGLPNPRASKELVNVLKELIGFDIETKDLDLSAAETDKILQNMEEEIGQLGIHDLGPQERKADKETDEEIPKQVFEKIERLFEESKKDKKTAHRLKEELDRWNLFKFYEDRFLDLFKELH